MELGRPNIAHLKNSVDGLLMKIVGVPDEKGTGIIRFQLFKECKIAEDERGGWYIEIDAHDRALPLMFDLKSHFFKYELWNALRLKSKNQLRMYETLKQYERVGYRIISVEKLRSILGIGIDEYTKFNDFRRDVLDVCQKALAVYTDISYVYEPHGKKGRGGKILELKFSITKNKGFVDPLGLDEFIELKNESIAESDIQKIDFDDTDENGIVRATGRHWKYEERITVLAEACMDEFSREQIAVLFDKMPEFVKYDENTSSDYLQSKYREMEMRKPEKSRFGYLKKIIGEEREAL
jgi:hypothetical protein